MKFFKWLAEEIRKLFPITLFFFVGSGYPSNHQARPAGLFGTGWMLSRAMLFSLVAGKVVLLLENVRLDERFPNWPRCQPHRAQDWLLYHRSDIRRRYRKNS